MQHLHVCNVRKDHSVQVSELESNINEHGNDFDQTWSKIGWPMNYKEKWSEHARDLLEGPPQTSSRGDKHIPKARDELPEFFISNEDVRFWEKLKATTNVSPLKPFKLHLCCDGMEIPHKVLGQPGKDLKLKVREDDVDLKLLRPVVEVLVKKVVGANIDGLINIIFDTADLKTTDFERLVEMMKSNDSHPRVPSDREVQQELENHIVSTGFLKDFINVKDDDFREHFLLTKYFYKDRPGGFGWLCDVCHKEACANRMLKTHSIELGD